MYMGVTVASNFSVVPRMKLIWSLKRVTMLTAIQPKVPMTRMPGNCFAGLSIWRSETAFMRGHVGT